MTPNLPPRPHLPAQPNSNPNNKIFQPAYATDMIGYPAYYISLIECNDINIWSSQVLSHGIPPIIIEQEEEEIQPLEVSDFDYTLVNNYVHNSENESQI